MPRSRALSLSPFIINQTAQAQKKKKKRSTSQGITRDFYALLLSFSHFIFITD